MELMEPFKKLEEHNPGEDEKCPFCPIQEKYDYPDSKVSDENNSITLGTNLENKGDLKRNILNMLYEKTKGIHGQYSAQAHHLICGKEILGAQKEIESWLCKEGKHNGKLQPCDTGYNVNSAKNGIWLPSTPLHHKKEVKVETAQKLHTELIRRSDTIVKTLINIITVPLKLIGVFKNYIPELKELGYNPVGNKLWGKLEPDAKNIISFAVMLKAKLQFHLSSHTAPKKNEDRAERCYVKKGIKHLETLTIYVKHYSNKCPMEKDGKTRSKPPYLPPLKLNRYLDILSSQMKIYITGHPKKWKYFISKWAWLLTNRLTKSPKQT